MRLGDIVNPEAADRGRPLEGVRVLALEQMQALPFATQLLGRLGAEVVKVEAPGGGDLGRSSMPAMTDPLGRPVGATFMRNNLSKRSVVIDLKNPRGRDLVLRMAPRFDVVAENFRAGAAERLGLAYNDIVAVHPRVVYLSISGFGRSVPHGTPPSPYDGWPALASMVEAMSGAYEFKRTEGQAPIGSPMGGLGDIVTALFAVIGLLAGLRQRERTGAGQQIDVAMLDAMVAVLDVVPNFWSMGMPMGTPWPGILHGFRAADGWFMLQVLRPHQWPDLARAIDRPEWEDDPRFATTGGWLDLLESDIRPAIEGWAADRSKHDACEALNAAGLVAGPCATDAEVVADPHLAQRHMLVEHPRTDGVAQPVLIPGLPIKFGQVAEGPESRVPWLGEHTDEILTAELGLDEDALTDLRAAKVIGS
ncbi:MAG TPA: CoA transferase [Acidimicrobiales bacterium]|nr:CoA transferase [Acidimicrobiales bacterium]